jgi:hypothetical protein
LSSILISCSDKNDVHNSIEGLLSLTARNLVAVVLRLAVVIFVPARVGAVVRVSTPFTAALIITRSIPAVL